MLSRQLLLLCVLVFTTGCGGGSELVLVPVSGKVTLESGGPIEGARISFMPEAGGVASQAVTGADGTFTLRTSTGQSGAVVGKHKITIVKESADTAVNFNDPSALADAAARRGGGGGGRQRNSEPTGARATGDASIPKRYGSITDTPFSYDVTADGNHGNVSLVISGE